jgi:hypothetical protein
MCLTHAAMPAAPVERAEAEVDVPVVVFAGAHGKRI